jgi:hypothetical protein
MNKVLAPIAAFINGRRMDAGKRGRYGRRCYRIGARSVRRRYGGGAYSACRRRSDNEPGSWHRSDDRPANP